MHEETSRASLSMMIPRDQTVSSWYTAALPRVGVARWGVGRVGRRIVYRRQDTDIVRRQRPASRGQNVSPPAGSLVAGQQMTGGILAGMSQDPLGSRRAMLVLAICCLSLFIVGLDA